MSAPALYTKLLRLAAPSSGAPAPERAVARRKIRELRAKHPEIPPCRAFCAGSTAGARGAWGVLLLLPEGTISEHKGALQPRPELNAAWCELVAIGAAIGAWLQTERPDPLVVLAPSWAISTIEGHMVPRDRYKAIVARIRGVLARAKEAELEVRFMPLGEHRNLAEWTARLALEAA